MLCLLVIVFATYITYLCTFQLESVYILFASSKTLGLMTVAFSLLRSVSVVHEKYYTAGQSRSWLELYKRRTCDMFACILVCGADHADVGAPVDPRVHMN